MFSRRRRYRLQNGGVSAAIRSGPLRARVHWLSGTLCIVVALHIRCGQCNGERLDGEFFARTFPIRIHSVVVVVNAVRVNLGNGGHREIEGNMLCAPSSIARISSRFECQWIGIAFFVAHQPQEIQAEGFRGVFSVRSIVGFRRRVELWGRFLMPRVIGGRSSVMFGDRGTGLLPGDRAAAAVRSVRSECGGRRTVSGEVVARNTAF